MPNLAKKISLLVLFSTLFTLLVGITPARAEINNEFSLVPSGEFDSGYRVSGENGSSLKPMVFRVKNGSQTFRVYCAEATVGSNVSAKLKLADWNEYLGANKLKEDQAARLKVSWITVNSYPGISVEELSAKAGISGLNEVQAVTATQSAIWHFTDGFKLAMVNEGGKKAGENVKALYNYLVGTANTGLEVQAPKLEIVVPENANAGTLVGPIRFNSNAQTVKIEKLAFQLQDAEGKKISEDAVPANQDLFLNVPGDQQAGSADIVAKAVVGGYSGQVLVPSDPAQVTQTIVVAEGQPLETCDRATVSWLDKPRPVVPYAAPTPSETPSAPVETPEAEVTPSAPATTPAAEAPVAKKSESSKPGLPKTGAQGAGMLALAALVSVATVRVLRNR